MTYSLADLLDIPRLQVALDSLYNSSRIPSAIIGIDGKVHTGSGWQDICTNFHRVHPEAEKRCIESDLYINRHIHEAKPSIVYKCPHGLVDAATPIVIEGEHLGNVFTGQLFLEEPDLDYFRFQARKYGFDEKKYIEAVKSVPVITEQALWNNLDFIADLTGMLVDLGVKHKKEIRVEQGLRKCEERFRNIFRENSSVMLLIDPHSGRIEDANPAAAAFYGYPEDVLRTMAISQIDTMPDIENATERMRALRKERESFIFFHRLASGEIRTVEVRSSPVEVEGRFLLFSIVTDITMRKQAEEELREKRQLNQILLDNMPCVTLLLRPHSREIVASNKAGMNAGAFPGTTCFSTWGQRKEPCPWCLAPKAWNAGEAQHLIVEDGGVVWDAHWIPVGPDLYMHFAFDISERRNLEVQLRQSQKMETVGRLAGGIAHDFNNLLTAIEGYSDLLLSGLGEDNPLSSDVREIRKAGAHASALTRQLLAFSRMQVMQPKVINLNIIVANMEKMITRLIGENVQLVTVPGENLGHVKTDKGQIEQVLLNLVVNARDAMPNGGRITIETSNVELSSIFTSRQVTFMPGSYVMLAVTDTGCGMDEKTMSHIFEPFYTTKEKGKGTGLGLATVYGIVKQSNGYITVDSKPGCGAAFKVYLPMVNEEPEKDKALPQNPPNKFTGKETVLVVDDTELVRILVKEVLTRSGYDVLEATNGEEALSICSRREEPIHFLLTDMMMPNMSGRELAGAISSLCPGIKVLYMSGYTEYGSIENACLPEGSFFIQKPFSVATLLKKIREVMDS